MKFRFSIKETPTHWTGKCFDVEEPDRPIWTLTVARKPTKNAPADRHGVNASSSDYIHEATGIRTENINIRSANEFANLFIRGTQRIALKWATWHGAIMCPVNGQPECWWTPDFIQELAKALPQNDSDENEMRRVRRWRHEMLENFLLGNYESAKLYRMDRKELAAFMKANFWIPISRKPDAIWKMVQRMGLKTERTPGPRGNFRV